MHGLGERAWLAASKVRRRALGLALASVAGLTAFGLLVFAAYGGLARVLAPELAAASLAAALALLAWLAHARTRDRARAQSPPPEPPPPDPAQELGAAVTALLRRAQTGTSDLATASLVAGFVVGSRRRATRRSERDADAAGAGASGAASNGRDTAARRW